MSAPRPGKRWQGRRKPEGRLAVSVPLRTARERLLSVTRQHTQTLTQFRFPSIRARQTLAPAQARRFQEVLLNLANHLQSMERAAKTVENKQQQFKKLLGAGKGMVMPKPIVKEVKVPPRGKRAFEEYLRTVYQQTPIPNPRLGPQIADYFRLAEAARNVRGTIAQLNRL